MGGIMNVIRFESGECKKIRPFLDSYINDELLVETNHEVLKHLETCKACATELDSLMRVRRALQTAVRQDVAPIGLQHRIQREIRKQQPNPPYQWRTWMLAAAAMLVLTAGSWGVLKAIKSREAPADGIAKRQDAQVLNIGLGDHIHCAIDSQLADKHFTDEEMSMKLGPEFIALVSLVKDQVPGGYEVVVGHRCKFNQREFVHLILKKQNKVMSLVLTRKNSEAFSSAALGNVIEAGGVRLHSEDLQDYQVTGFETRDYLAFVVSNLAPQENRLIATNLAPAVRDYLARMEL
jgi:hypothetical protein